MTPPSPLTTTCNEGFALRIFSTCIEISSKPRGIFFVAWVSRKNVPSGFIEIINGNPIDKANIQEGLDVIKILEMATKSLKE